jgi:RND family efflux transporter MFP subunit
MSTRLDLKQLAIDRGPPKDERAAPPRHLLSRYVLPGSVLAGLGLVTLWAARDSLLPARPVTVVPVVIARAEVREAGTPLFQAPGWVEPRPTPVLVSALADGVIEELLVVEDQPVRSGEPVARLIDVDARLALERARADLQLVEAEASHARAELAAVETRIEQPLHLEAALAEADYLLAKVKTELAGLPLQIRAAEARVLLAEQELEGKRAAGEAVAGRLIQRAQSELDRARSEREELLARQTQLKREIEALERKRGAAARQLELKLDEKADLAQAEARVKAAEARVRQARLAVDAAELQFERMVVRAPVAGRVLQLNAQPGKRVAGLSPNSLYDAGIVVSLYDPQRLQLRCDVRLEDVPLVEPGQPVRIETAALPEPIEGEVLHVTSTADVQKNTLEVKVAIRSPRAPIKPDMLVQATFLAPPKPEAKSEEADEPLRLLVPRALVETTDEGPFVWIADAAGRVRRRSIVLGRAGTDDLIEVAEGLNATDKLISGGRDTLRPDERIRIRGEDAVLGIEPSPR